MAPTPASNPSACTILLIEDSGFTRRLIRGMLRALGYTKVVEAANGLAALRHLKTHTVDLILLDWRMPKTGGADVLDRLRASENPRTALTPVVIISAHVDIALLQQAAELGARSVVAKPFSIAILKTHIEAALGRERASVQHKAEKPAEPTEDPFVEPPSAPDGDETEIFYL